MNITLEFLKLVLASAIGAGIAARLTLWVDRKKQDDRRSEERSVAMMMVATDLRRWIHQAAEMIWDARNMQSSSGNLGRFPSGLADFRFESSLEQLARLRPSQAEAILDLVYEKSQANVSAQFHREVYAPTHDFDDPGADRLCASAAQISQKAIAIYKGLAAEVGWSQWPFSDKERELFAKEASSDESSDV